MSIIDLKMILMFVMAAVPFTFAMRWRPAFATRFFEGMKRSNNFRKFFTLVILMVMIALEFIDFQASTAIATMMHDGHLSVADAAQTIGLYGALMTRPYATLLAAVMSLAMFSYKWADTVLTYLHNHPKHFVVVAAVAMLIAMVSPRYIIVTEMLEIVLLAAYIYPDRNGNITGGGIPQSTMRDAVLA